MNKRKLAKIGHAIIYSVAEGFICLKGECMWSGLRKLEVTVYLLSYHMPEFKEAKSTHHAIEPLSCTQMLPLIHAKMAVSDDDPFIDY